MSYSLSQKTHIKKNLGRSEEKEKLSSWLLKVQRRTNKLKSDFSVLLHKELFKNVYEMRGIFYASSNTSLNSIYPIYLRIFLLYIRERMILKSFHKYFIASSYKFPSAFNLKGKLSTETTHSNTSTGTQHLARLDVFEKINSRYYWTYKHVLWPHKKAKAFLVGHLFVLESWYSKTQIKN